jgi:Domain of unknown function (DUF1905)
VVLIYRNSATWRALPAGEADRVVKLHNDLIDELTASGEFVGIHRLADAGNARTVALRDGVPAVTDGPFGSGKRPAVAVTVNGYRYRSTVASMGGVAMVSLSAEHRAGAGVAGGDEVEVDLELDTAPGR